MDSKKRAFQEAAEKVYGKISRIFLLLFLFVILPMLILLVVNFFKLVIMGEMTMSQFKDSLPQYSYGPVVDFYDCIRQWLMSLMGRLKQ